MVKITIKSSVYEQIIEAAKEINRRTDNEDLKERRKKFLRRKDFPTVEILEQHNIKTNFETFLPYLIYYMEPEIFQLNPDEEPYKSNTNLYKQDCEKLKRTRKYIRDIFNEKVEIIYDDEEETLTSESN